MINLAPSHRTGYNHPAKRKSDVTGPLAHPVERFHGMEEVSGSSPLGSTFTIKPLASGIYCAWTLSKQTALLAGGLEQRSYVASPQASCVPRHL